MAWVSASGFAEYVYRDPAVASTSSSVVTTAGSASRSTAAPWTA
jgi:hypothetical protein